MQTIAPPQGVENPQGYTRDEILHVLRGHLGSRKFSFRYNLLDSNNDFKDDVTDIVTDGAIDQNWLAPIKRTANFEVLGIGDERIDYLVDRFQPWIRLHMPTKMVASGTEITTLWDNTFDAASGILTPENSLGTGDPVSATSGTVSYDGLGYMVLGRTDGGTTPENGSGAVSFGVKSRNSLKYTIWCNIPVGGALNVGVDGETVDLSRWIRIDDIFLTEYRLGSVDVTALKDNFLGGDIRIEVVYDGRQTRYSVFWSDPYLGTSPDFTASEDASDWGQLRLFQLSGGGFTRGATRVTRFLVEVPGAPELEPKIQPLWSNNFNGPTGATITSSLMGLTGNVPEAVGGDRIYTDNWSIDNVRSAQLGVTDAGWIRVATPGRDQWFLRMYGYIPTGGRLMAMPMNDESFLNLNNDSPLDIIARPGPWVYLDDSEGVWDVAGTDVSAFSTRLVDVPFRIELEVVGTQYNWRIYIVDPNGRSPDISWSGSIDSDWTNIRWFSFWGGGESTVPVMIDNVLIGDPQPTFVAIPESENYVEWPQGVFVLSSPLREIDENAVITRQIEGYDVIQTITNDKLEDRLVVTAGTRYTDVVNQLLGDRPKLVTPSTTTAARDREWAVGYSIRQTINDMLQSINYESISADERGNFVVRPYVLPDKRTPEFNYFDDQDSVIMPQASQELDLFEVANKWILTVSNPDLPPMKAVLTNNDPANPTSTVRRQQTIVDFREEEDSPSQAALMRKAQRHAWAASRKFEGVEFDTLMMPFHSGNDCYNIRYTDLGVDEKYLEHYWIMRLRAGERMQHRARRVVNFNPHDETFHMNNVEITGALKAGNIHAGIIAITPTPNIPTMGLVTGFELAGSGSVDVQVTIESNNPAVARQAGTQKEGPRAFEVWLFRTTSTATNVHYFATRNP